MRNLDLDLFLFIVNIGIIVTMASPTSTDEEVVLNFEASRQRTEIENLQSQLEAAKAAVTRAEDLVEEKTQLEDAYKERILELRREREQNNYNARKQMAALAEKERQREEFRAEAELLRQRLQRFEDPRGGRSSQPRQSPRFAFSPISNSPRPPPGVGMFRPFPSVFSPMMGMPRYDVPMPRQNLFDGKESWDGFIQPFRSLARTCGWDDNEKLFRLWYQ